MLTVGKLRHQLLEAGCVLGRVSSAMMLLAFSIPNPQRDSDAGSHGVFILGWPAT